jgi:polyhydroxyalkanoate synthesis regulator phasin
MPERINKLRATVTELEAELAGLSEVDDETRAVLEEAVREIQDALHEQPETLEHQTLSDRLRDAAKDFEASHPTLYGVVTRTIDALAQMGI